MSYKKYVCLVPGGYGIGDTVPVALERASLNSQSYIKPENVTFHIAENPSVGLNGTIHSMGDIVEMPRDAWLGLVGDWFVKVPASLREKTDVVIDRVAGIFDELVQAAEESDDPGVQEKFDLLADIVDAALLKIRKISTWEGR